jgi:hypothetical protein
MSSLLHVATRKGLFVVEGVGASAAVVSAHFVGDNVPLTASDPRDGAWYAVLDHGHFGIKLHRSDDVGATWDEIAVPEYPPKPDDFVDIDMWGQPREWTLANIWALEPALDRSGALWAGTVPGGLFRSLDRGDSWTLIESLWDVESRTRWGGAGNASPALHSIWVDPDDPSSVTLAISSGGVWRTHDLGESWTSHTTGMIAGYVPPEQAELPEHQDAHRIAVCAGSPRNVWCQHHMGIWRSTDDLVSWRQIHVEPTASSFGFAVAVHPEEPDTAWFVPAHSDEKRTPIDGRVVVTRTRDGGASFEVLSNGLPQRHAYDLVLRHALDISADGQQLAFGSTTGNLWVTDDQGDEWHTVATNLPPIYSVRYA